MSSIGVIISVGDAEVAGESREVAVGRREHSGCIPLYAEVECRDGEPDQSCCCGCRLLKASTRRVRLPCCCSWGSHGVDLETLLGALVTPRYRRVQRRFSCIWRVVQKCKGSMLMVGAKMATLLRGLGSLFSPLKCLRHQIFGHSLLQISDMPKSDNGLAEK